MKTGKDAIPTKYFNEVDRLCNDYGNSAGHEINQELCQSADVEEYLFHLINTEKNIMILRERLAQLLMDHDNAIDAKKATEKNVTEDTWERVRRLYPLEEGDYDYARCGLIMPHKPKEPEFLLVFPEEPDYEKAGLFNRLKVSAINEHKKKDFEEKVAVYYAKKREYENNRKIYEEECKEYQSRIRDYEEKKRAVTASLSEERTKHNNEMRCKREAHAGELISQNSKLNNAIAVVDMCQGKIEEAKQKLKELYKCRVTLLGFNIIFPKYLTMVALTTIYEYFVTGRSSSLKGPDGAYNLYESEMRANVVINRLDSILESLEAIKETQYMTYTVLSEIKDTVDDLDSKMTIATLSALGSTVLLNNINTNLKVIEYNSAAAAYYNKVNAELTDAMGYLVAFK